MRLFSLLRCLHDSVGALVDNPLAPPRSMAIRAAGGVCRLPHGTPTGARAFQRTGHVAKQSLSRPSVRPAGFSRNS